MTFFKKEKDKLNFYEVIKIKKLLKFPKDNSVILLGIFSKESSNENLKEEPTGKWALIRFIQTVVEVLSPKKVMILFFLSWLPC